MAYCHECGSEITEGESFCPFCGISLQPVTVADDPETGTETGDGEESAAPRNTGEDPATSEELTADQLTSEPSIETGDAEPALTEEPAAAVEASEEDGDYMDISALREEPAEPAAEVPDEPAGTGSRPDEEAEPTAATAGDQTGVDVEPAPEPASSEPPSEESEAIPAEPDAETREPDTPTDISEPSESIDSAGAVTDPEPATETGEHAGEETEFSEGQTLISTPFPTIDQPSAGPVTPEHIADEATSREEAPASAGTESTVPEPAAGKIAAPTETQDEQPAADVSTAEDAPAAGSDTGGEPPTDVTSASEPAPPESPAEPASSDAPATDEPEAAAGPESAATGSGTESDVPEQADPTHGESTAAAPATPSVEEQPAAPAESAAGSEAARPGTGVGDEASDVEEPAPRTQTTPNMGVGDTDGSKAPKLKPLDEGTVLNGRYEIVRKIGGGGMGAVYLANDKNLGGVLRAVKEMVQSYIEPEQQEKAINDFKRESMLLTSLEHSSIPTIYDYFFDDKEGRFYLVMKYISGGDLAARLRSAPEGKLDEENVTEWAIQITDVLDYLHSRNPPIVYRDLKPANIMIDSNNNRVMLIDFGIARWINKEEKGVTAVGTMGYAPPELFSGNVEPSSDIYSLGSTMFHLLTGADPQNNPLLIFDFQKHPRPRQINPQLSDQIERILMQAVEYNADRRFGSAAEMRQALTEHLENLKAGRVTYGVKETPSSVALSDQPVFCGFCGQKIVATDMFCAFCGAKQPMAQPGVHSEEYNLGKYTARLVIEGTTELDYPSFELVKEENLVGRRDPMSNIFPEVDLSKYDPQTKISRKHARIRRDGDRYLLEDLGSSNGTTLVPVRKDSMKMAPHQPQPLQNGDKIILGDTTLQFIVG